MGSNRKTKKISFTDTGIAINRGVKFISSQLSRPLTIELHMEDYMDGAVIKPRKSHRPRNEDRDWSTFYQQSVDHTKAMQLFQYEQRAYGHF